MLNVETQPLCTGYEKAPEWLETQAIKSRGGGRAKEWHRNYRQDCEAAVKDGEEEEDSPWKNLVGNLVLGSKEFVAELLEGSQGNKGDEMLNTTLAARPSFEEIIAAVEEIKKESWADFRDRRGDWGRELALYLGREKGGMSLRALCEGVGSGKVMAISQAIKRFRSRLSREKSLSKAAAQTSRKLQTTTSNV